MFSLVGLSYFFSDLLHAHRQPLEDDECTHEPTLLQYLAFNILTFDSTDKDRQVKNLAQTKH